MRAALDLFIDFAASFTRLLAILVRRAQQGGPERRQRDARSRLHQHAHPGQYAHRY